MDVITHARPLTFGTYPSDSAEESESVAVFLLTKRVKLVLVNYQVPNIAGYIRWETEQTEHPGNFHV
jgi:hypothetical protein